ncbi:mechanosensitive ion channel family protein [Clostridium sp. JN-9]|uniref:mechanosensitive ion channel family protein n=1 Tax=Clostridium sp. JN-9 TaxID=2507159 RepID=UPI000FFDFF3F|nr:mechanosensitive ion channel family protein [Clostridium sp. JN-9]QAT41545.1 mechanosensitive ion channel family protein [Clostridium sp. JN-9]
MIKSVILNILEITYNESGIKIANFTISKESIYNTFEKFLKVIIILILMYASIKIGNGIINRFISKQKKLKFSLDDRKAKTLGAVLKSVLRYSVYFFGIFAIIEIVFGKIGSIFAGLGGVAIGLGGQNLIKDIINGFFILFEDQFSVGDYVSIEGKDGIVEGIELRVTKIRDFNGDLHIIPNGIIKMVTNHSRGNMRVLLDINISYDENIDKAIEVITDECEKFKNKNNNVVEGPRVLGISEISEDGISVKVFAKVKPMMQWDIEMKLRRDIKNRLDESKIKMAYKRVEVINTQI